MNVQREGGIRAESGSAMSGKLSRARLLTSTRSLRPDSQFDRYLVTACSLMIALMLVVGAAGYAGIHGLLSSTTTRAKAARFERVDREADQDHIVTPAAIALTLMAALLLAVAASPEPLKSPGKYPIDTA